ncbi:hypothetical protein O6H91_15G089100 [Diphasiastrum complanatum]|uniref:Uncharacterized protein n=2 Tax=Diphasiastrum complanatum TaxID=34168 RepID=A0ACC2BKK6_DIPCM|nr:hypothetical protein O6H91_15G088200 [Diphasiastrum complanatum]KAJ7530319.1 hypothetical protein O6H91_15G089100 [Diphasiastrum complanatum]
MSCCRCRTVSLAIALVGQGCYEYWCGTLESLVWQVLETRHARKRPSQLITWIKVMIRSKDGRAFWKKDSLEW